MRGPSAWHEAGGRYLKKRGLRGDFFRAAVGKMDELRESCISRLEMHISSLKMYISSLEVYVFSLEMNFPEASDGFCAERMLFGAAETVFLSAVRVGVLWILAWIL